MVGKSKQEENFETLKDSIINDLNKYLKPSVFDKLKTEGMKRREKDWVQTKTRAIEQAIHNIEDIGFREKNYGLDRSSAEKEIITVLSKLTTTNLEAPDRNLRRARGDYLPEPKKEDRLDTIVKKYTNVLENRAEKRNDPPQDKQEPQAPIKLRK